MFEFSICRPYGNIKSYSLLANKVGTNKSFTILFFTKPKHIRKEVYEAIMDNFILTFTNKLDISAELLEIYKRLYE